MYVIATSAEAALARNSGWATLAEATAVYRSLRHKAPKLAIWYVSGGKAVQA